MAKQRMIIAQFPITAKNRIIFNEFVHSKEAGLKWLGNTLGAFTEEKVAEMDGIVDTRGNKYMIFYGEADVHRLTLWISGELRKLPKG